jgi:hypothetical protein
VELNLLDEGIDRYFGISLRQGRCSDHAEPTYQPPLTIPESDRIIHQRQLVEPELLQELGRLGAEQLGYGTYERQQLPLCHVDRFGANRPVIAWAVRWLGSSAFHAWLFSILKAW